MLTFPTPQGRFNTRTVGVVLHAGRVLIHRLVRDDYWALPGGRVEFGGPAAHALAREFAEELHVTAAVGRLLWLVENFFTLDGVRYHEFDFIFLVTLPPGCPLYDHTGPFPGCEPHLPAIYQWQPLVVLDEITLHPRILRTGLLALPAATTHIVNVDPPLTP